MTSQADFDKLAKVCNATELVCILELLKVKKFRSEYREHLRSKVVEWLASPTPFKPLTPKEFGIITPHWPVKPLRSYITK
jgi:hypothetical protein